MMSPAGPQHGGVANELAYLLTAAVKAQRAGKVFVAETGFLIARNPDTVRAPDVAFVSAARLKDMPKRGFFPGAPDLVAEVLSPDDSASAVLSKAGQWIAAGVRVVLLVDPEQKSIAVYRGDQPMQSLSTADSLDLNDVVRGCAIAVADVFR